MLTCCNSANANKGVSSYKCCMDILNCDEWKHHCLQNICIYITVVVIIYLLKIHFVNKVDVSLLFIL